MAKLHANAKRSSVRWGVLRTCTMLASKEHQSLSWYWPGASARERGSHTTRSTWLMTVTSVLTKSK